MGTYAYLTLFCNRKKKSTDKLSITGIQPWLDPGIPLGGWRWGLKDREKEKDRGELTGLRGKPIKPVTSGLL